MTACVVRARSRHSHSPRSAHATLRAGASILTLTSLSPLFGTVAAQLISVKTIPVVESEQFGFFPSANLGMGGVSIALSDSLLDPFVNPATASRMRGSYFFGSPTFFSTSRKAGGGQTLPLGGIFSSGTTFGGVALAVQEISAGRRADQGGFFVADALSSSVGPIFSPPERASHGNRYAFAMLGRLIPEAKASVAASVMWSGLNAIDGVDMLYAGSQGIRQFGQALDFRLGALKEWKGDRSLEAVIVHNRFGMTHDVSYQDFWWDPATRRTIARERLEHNLDRTNTWGLHLEYERPLADSGWRIGGILTGNLLTHPKIPNYEIMNIPRDPGRSFAYNLGLGVSKREGPVTFGIDAIYEPIWSHTWAEADGVIQTFGGGNIPQGGKTIENRFLLSNALVRAGLSRDFELERGRSSARLQLGVQLRAIHYWLDQRDNVQLIGREQQEQWNEWTRTWGGSVRFPEVELHYRGRLTSGTGRPGVAGGGCSNCVDSPRSLSSSSFVVAPSGAISLDEVLVTTHQISVSLPLRRSRTPNR